MPAGDRTDRERPHPRIRAARLYVAVAGDAGPVAPTGGTHDPFGYRRVLDAEDASDDELRRSLRTTRAHVERWLRSATVRTGRPRFAWYRLSSGAHVQTGLVAELSAADLDRGLVAPHEQTRADVVDRLALHREVVGIDANPVAVAHRPAPELRSLAARCTAGPPAVEFTSDDGVGHTVWVVDDDAVTAEIARAASGVDRLYIADGHHRVAAAGAAPDVPGRETDRGVLAALFPADELRIAPFHRSVVRPRGASTDEVVAALARGTSVRRLSTGAPPARPHTWTAYVDGAWYALTPRRAVAADPPASLEVVALHTHVLGPAFGIRTPRRDPRIGYVAGDTTALAAHCDRTGAIGFALRPPTMDQVLTVADAGLVMPAKSTRFVPKTRSGTVVRPAR